MEHKSTINEILNMFCRMDKTYKTILAESQESKSISQAKNLVMQRLGYNEAQADEFVRIKLRNDIPILRTPQGGKFILGVTRMFLDGQLRNGNDIMTLNSTLKLIASDAHINEYDRNLNGLTAQDIIQKFSSAIIKDLENDKNSLSQMAFIDTSNYKIVPINSFEEAEEYGNYTTWCITHYEEMFDSYTADGINQFYFCLRNGFENVEPIKGENAPLDEYGLSMIAVSVDGNGSLATCTCRWNHDNGGNDNVMGTKEISRLIQHNFYEVFKPNNQWANTVNHALEQLKNGESYEDIFQSIRSYESPYIVVKLKTKVNLLNLRTNTFLSNIWFNGIDSAFEGLARVRIGNQENFLNINNGRLLSQEWFDYCNRFVNGFSRVYKNNQTNYINTEGKILSQEWFDDGSDFIKEGVAKVKQDDKLNFINSIGEIISDMWFDDVYEFKEGICRVAKWISGEMNYIDIKGNLLNKHWFSDCRDFHNGIGIVRNFADKWNFLNKNGEFLSKIWFDWIGSFSENFAIVEKNGMKNFVYINGQILSHEWFDECDNFVNGICCVFKNDKFNFLNTDGKILFRQWFDKYWKTQKGIYYGNLNGQWYQIEKNGNLRKLESTEFDLDDM
jgi:hypothetical protein